MRWSKALLVIASLTAAATPVRAQVDVLQIIPDDAMGFVVVNRISQTNDKITDIAKRLKIDIPGSPLEMLKGAIGVDKGIADKGTLAIAAFAKAEGEEPAPVFYVPVADYQAFIKQLEPGVEQEGITPVMLQDGKKLLAGKRGNYAVLAAEGDRALLERSLRSKQNLASSAAKMADWVNDNDVAGVLTTHGVKLLAVQARQGLDMVKQGFENLPPEAQGAAKFFDALQDFFKSVETDVTYAGFAARIDDGSLNFDVRAGFKPGSDFAKRGGKLTAPPGGPLAGLPAGPFVVAFGGTMPQDALRTMMRFNIEMMKMGAPDIEPATITKLENAFMQTMKGLNGMSMVWQVGKGKQSLFSHMVVVVHTDNADSYMENYAKSLRAINDLSKDLNLAFLPQYEIKEVKIGGKAGYEVRVDMTAMMQFPGAEVLKTLFDDGKLTVAIAARDDKTVVMRYTPIEGLKPLLKADGPGLAQEASVLQATKALPAGAQWALYISPNGLTQFADRMIKEFSPIPLQLPQFPETPPIAAGVKVSGERFEMRIVVPSSVVDNIGRYVEQLKMMFGGGV